MAKLSRTSVLAVGLVLAACLVVLVLLMRRADAPRSVPPGPGAAAPGTAEAGASATGPKPAPDPAQEALTRERWLRLRLLLEQRQQARAVAAKDAAAKAAEAEAAEPEEEGPATGAAVGLDRRETVMRVHDQLGQIARACADDAGVAGRVEARLTAHLLGEPDIGAIVEDVEVAEGADAHPELSECLRESLYTVAVDTPVMSMDEEVLVIVMIDRTRGD